MTNQENVIHCHECDHCFKNKRSKTGYSCEVWGHDDFASDTTLSGYCHKATLKRPKTLDSSDGIHMFKTEEEVISTLSNVINTINIYGVALRCDYKDLIGKEPEAFDGNYGWFKSDIEKMRIVQTERGYFIEFPQASFLL